MNFPLSWLSHLLYLEKETQVSGVRSIAVPPPKLGGPEGVLRRESVLPMGFSTLSTNVAFMCPPQPISTKCINTTEELSRVVNLLSSSLACLHVC